MEHVRRFQRGHRYWNAWRKANPDVVPDLSGTKFERRDLRYMDLTCANLRGSVFDGAILTYARLYAVEAQNASFKRVNLCDINATGGVFLGVSFVGSNCARADFSYADLRETNFATANLDRVVLKYAQLDKAKIRNAKNLRSIIFNKETIFPKDYKLKKR